MPLARRLGFVDQLAVNSKITDAGNYWAGTETEAALQEAGAQLAQITPKDTVVSDNTYNAAWITGTWTADNTTDTLICSADHGLVAGNPVSFGAGTGALPAGIAAEPDFYYVESAPTTKTIKIKATYNGAALNITDDGTVGWQIRLAYVLNSSQSLDFSLYSEIDMYTNFEYIPLGATGTGYPYLAILPNTTRALLNHANAYGASNEIGLTPTTSKKYVKLPTRINIKKIAASLYHIQIFIAGLQSDNLNMTTPTAYTGYYSGYITGADITGITLREGYTVRAKNGIRFVVVRR